MPWLPARGSGGGCAEARRSGHLLLRRRARDDATELNLSPMKVDAAGKVTNIRLVPAAPAKDASCIQKLWQRRSVQSFNGPPGELDCECEAAFGLNMGMTAGKGSYVPAKPAPTRARKP
jgi:hypothetical protein